MSGATGHGVMMISAGWWPDEGDDSDDVVIEVDRSDDDEVALTIRGVGHGDNPGTLYLNRSMALELANMLASRASLPTRVAPDGPAQERKDGGAS